MRLLLAAFVVTFALAVTVLAAILIRDEALAVALGDANCDTRVDAVDASFILQFHASLLPSVPCALAADVNLDQSVNPLDATLILQYDAGLIGRLPPLSVTPPPGPTLPPPPTFTPRPTFTPTPSPQLSAAEAIALAYEWLTDDPPGAYSFFACCGNVSYSSCEATWRSYKYWLVVCEGTIYSPGRLPSRSPLPVCVFDRTGIVVPTSSDDPCWP
ncbi:MAG: dockerin type I repeat-containing protein [Chloroflexi bacterium]|nr:dockerin type I repeat-containing protein [Chloroflexota bacterium]